MVTFGDDEKIGPPTHRRQTAAGNKGKRKAEVVIEMRSPKRIRRKIAVEDEAEAIETEQVEKVVPPRLRKQNEVPDADVGKRSSQRKAKEKEEQVEREVTPEQENEDIPELRRSPRKPVAKKQFGEPEEPRTPRKSRQTK